MTPEQISELQKAYLPGTRIQLEEMKDPYSKLQSGDKGTVEFIDSAGQIHVRWDNGEGLALIPEADKFKRLSIDDQIIEAETQKEELIAEKQRNRGRNQRQDKELDETERGE